MLAEKTPVMPLVEHGGAAPKNWRAIFETSRLTPTRYRSHPRGTVLTVTLWVMP
jgi:hypothetical protein